MEMSATELGAAAIRAGLLAANLPPDSVDEVYMGCVLAAGLGQAPARQASIRAGIPNSVPATTINKMCGSGMKSVMIAQDSIELGRSDIAVAGGMESMSNAPYLLPKLRSGARMGHAAAVDHMFLDGLEDAYESGRLMGEFAEDCAQSYQFTRDEQDDYAKLSLRRALESAESGMFDSEIQAVKTNSRRVSKIVSEDEQPLRAMPDKISRLKPAFRENGTVTAANSSSISDGAAALILASEAHIRKRNLPVLARIVGHSSAALAPSQFTIAPIHAAQTLLDSLGWRASDVDLWEVNEAFAVVSMAFQREFRLSSSTVNLRGGSCALGHPIGASGARILVTLLHALRELNLRRGIAAICIGGGEATAVAVERD